VPVAVILDDWPVGRHPSSNSCPLGLRSRFFPGCGSGRGDQVGAVGEDHELIPVAGVELVSGWPMCSRLVITFGWVGSGRWRGIPEVGVNRYRGCMDGVTSYEQLQAMTPEQRRAHFYASIVLDPSALRPGLQRRLEEMGAELDERQRAREERLRGQAP
jgi:hypothetical protein